MELESKHLLSHREVDSLVWICTFACDHWLGSGDGKRENSGIKTGCDGVTVRSTALPQFCL